MLSLSLGLFLQGDEINLWLQKYDTLFRNVYSNVTLTIALYLLLRCWHSGDPNLADKVRMLVSISPQPKFRLAFTHDIISFAITTSNTLCGSIFYLLSAELKHVSMRPYIEAAVRYRPEFKFTSPARSLLKYIIPGESSHIADFFHLGRAIRTALEEGETEVSAIIIHRMSTCKSSKQIDNLIIDLYGRLLHDVCPNMYYSNPSIYKFTKERMEAVKQQVRYKLIWQHRYRYLPWKLLSMLHYVPHQLRWRSFH